MAIVTHRLLEPGDVVSTALYGIYMDARPIRRVDDGGDVKPIFIVSVDERAPGTSDAYPYTICHIIYENFFGSVTMLRSDRLQP